MVSRKTIIQTFVFGFILGVSSPAGAMREKSNSTLVGPAVAIGLCVLFRAAAALSPETQEGICIRTGAPKGKIRCDRLHFSHLLCTKASTRLGDCPVSYTQEFISGVAYPWNFFDSEDMIEGILGEVVGDLSLECSGSRNSSSRDFGLWRTTNPDPSELKKERSELNGHLAKHGKFVCSRYQESRLRDIHMNSRSFCKRGCFPGNKRCFN